MDLRRLEALVALEREGTMSAAAEALGCGQPTISHHLRRLEEETGAVLVQRAGRGVRLTPDGVRLAERGREILALLRRAELELDAATTLASGHVRLAAFPSACSVIVPKLLVRLRESAPGLHVDLVEAEPPEAAAMLRAGEVDLAVTFAYAGQGFGGDVVTEHLGWDALHLVEGTAHAAVVGRTKTKDGGVEPDALGALADARWVAGCERCRTGLVDLCESVGVSPRIDFASDDVVAVQALVAAGFGVTLLPDLALRAHRDAGVATQPMRGAGRELQVATFGAMPRPAAVEEVVQTLLELMREGAFAY
ncbi:LysR family transcriptional regulator [Dermacoccus barathri]|uniref:LysR family transcriptional regulator n=1 Tax=Dermacoccus barathri TaxID=322601 RepID=UPI0018796247|nr:LysR family transcriptional regulator [Dermacoccus barathri]MBE7372726.1 LysR family transcriptional regulator [Dermacoccus barathri]